jgi:hypothetical protein
MGNASTTKVIKLSGGALVEQAALTTSAGAADANAIPALNANGVLDPTIVNAKVVSAGAGDAGKVVQLDGTGRIDPTVLPVGIGADTAALTASEALAAGDYVNVFDSGAGAFGVRKADATVAGKEAHGFVLVAVAQGNPASVYFEGTNTQVTGQTPGSVFLQTTAGKGAAAVPGAAGNVVQNIGFAVSATAVNFQYNRPITKA